MIYITLHLHAYQPPTQDKNIFEKIHDESYEPIINLLEKNPEFSLSLDIAKSLAERWPTEFTGRIARLCRDNRIYLVNTSAYHYLLPLFGEQTILRQMKLNQDFYRENFTQDKQIRGVFPPELAFSPRLAAIAKKAGALWIMADDEPFIYKRLHLPEVQRAPRNWIPITYGCGVVLRSRFWSNRISRGQYENGQSFAHEILIQGGLSDISKIQGDMVAAGNYNAEFGRQLAQLVPEVTSEGDQEITTPPPDRYIFNQRSRSGTQVV